MTVLLGICGLVDSMIKSCIISKFEPIGITIPTFLYCYQPFLLHSVNFSY